MIEWQFIHATLSTRCCLCMLVCARIGAVHSVVFAGFSAEAFASRINDGIDSLNFTFSLIGLNFLFKTKEFEEVN